MDPAAHVHVPPVTKAMHVAMPLPMDSETVTSSVVPFGRCVAVPLGVVLTVAMVPLGPLSVMPGAAHVPATQMSPALPQSVEVMQATQTAGATDRSQSGVALVQPASVDPEGALSTHTTHSGALALPLQTPVAQAVPAAIGGCAQLPALHWFAVHSLPSSQSPGAVHPTQRKPPMPLGVHWGAPALQPRSCPIPPTVSMHPTQTGFEAAPSQTPPGHMAPRTRDVLTQRFATHVSVEQAFESLQWTSSTQAWQMPLLSQWPPATHCASERQPMVPISMRQLDEQPSPFVTPPSSQPSPASTWPLPQPGTRKGL